MANLRRSRRPLGALSVAALVVVALILGLTLGAEAKRTHKPKAAPAAAADCKTDADCVLVPDDCCSCNHGGKQRAIPKKQKDTYEKDRKKRCADTQCMEMMSQDPSCSQHAFCAAGICELSD
jgi:ribosomal protein L32